MPYTDVHRLFVQVMLSHKLLAEKQALAKYQEVYQCLNDEEHAQVMTIADLKALVNDINRKIKRMNLEIRLGICEVSMKRYYVLVNTVAVPLNLTFKKYSVIELEVFKKIVDEVVDSENGIVSSIKCMNVNVPGINKSNIELTIQKLVADQWIDELDGKYNLSVRTITEMGSYLKSQYQDDIDSCQLCKEIVFQGYRCPQCDTIIHSNCLEKYAKRTRYADGELKCPHPDCETVIDGRPIRDDSEDTMNPEENAEMDVDPEPEPEPERDNRKRVKYTRTQR